MTLETSLAIETTWAARLVTEPHRNTERRAEWEALKDMWRLWPASEPERPAQSNIMLFQRRKG